MVDVALVVDILRMHFDDPPADAAGFGIPAHVIADLEPLDHPAFLLSSALREFRP
jgi:hypothetical protein